MLPRTSPRWAPLATPIQPLVLLVQDAPDQWIPLQSALASQGFRVVYAPTGGRSLAGAMAHQPDLVLLDASSVVVDVAGLAAQLRERTAAPILAVLADASEFQRSAVLEAGVDDYVAKPFAAGDLVARMRVCLARGARQGGPRLGGGLAPAGLRFDAQHRTLYVEGRQVHVTPLECRLLGALGRGGATEDDSAKTLWGRTDASRRYYVRLHVRQLRQKIERDPDRPHYLVNESGGRYRLRAR